METAAHDVANPFKTGKVKAVQCGQPQFPQAAVEMPVQYPAGSPADQGDVHCHHEAHKCRVTAFIDGSDQIFVGFFSETFQSDDLIPIAVKVVEVLIAFQGADPDELAQRRFRKPPDVHGFLFCKVDELMMDAAATFGIVAVERLDGAPPVAFPGVDVCRMPAAGAGFWRHVLAAPAVQVVLHMWDDHVPFGYQDAASGVQLQPLDEGQVVQACPGYPAAVNLHGVEDCHRCDLTEASCLPFD